MGRFGFGFGHINRTANFWPQFLPIIEPGTDWNGTAGSGFAFAPTDPTRATAKPACRLMVPPNQYFTDRLLVGVQAGANNQGTLGATWGLEKVSFHFEGNVVDVTSPTWQTFTDANGVPVTYFGWWCWLKKPAATAGHANLYIEAVPLDGTMQNRVIGPYQFSPVATLHDYQLTIAPSLSEVTGERYQNPVAAMNYLRIQAAQNPRIHFVEDWTGNTNGLVINYDIGGAGWLTITAEPGVTATWEMPTSPDVEFNNTNLRLQTRYTRICYRGSNIVFDMKNVSNYTVTGAATGRWFDGCTFTTSDPAGARALVRGRPRSGAPFATSGFWFTEVFMEYLGDPLNGAALARGCVAREGYRDAMAAIACSVGTRIEEHDSSFWLTDKPAMSP
jgi:hypothetical protein